MLFHIFLCGTTKAAEKVFSLYQQHAEEVSLALERLVASHTSEMVYGRVGRGSLLRCMTDNCGIAAAVEPVAKKTVQPPSQLGPSNAELKSQIDEGFKSVLSQTMAQHKLVADMSAGPLEFLMKLSLKLSSQEHQLFMLLVVPANDGNSERHLTYEEIAKKLCGKGNPPVTRQAIGKRVKELKAKNHELKLFIANARRSEKDINFSEISPTQRRKAGIDETYGQSAYGK